MKHRVIAMTIHDAGIRVMCDGDASEKIPMKLPDGCNGILFVFESKKVAR